MGCLRVPTGECSDAERYGTLRRAKDVRRTSKAERSLVTQTGWLPCV